MLRGSRHLGKILGYSFSPIKFHISLLGSLASRRTWRHLAATVGTSRKRGGGDRVYKKPNGCSATRALASDPDVQQQQQWVLLKCNTSRLPSIFWILQMGNCSQYITPLRHAVVQSVEALRYKSEGRTFDPRWCHWNFSFT
jgi:hypothetical protein